MFNRKGFTLIELIMVTIILGILAAVAIPRYMTSVEKAEAAAEDAVISAIKAGLETYATEQLLDNGRRSWPTNPWDALDTKPAGYTTDATDADVDGSHIRTLLLTFFYRKMKEVIDGGYLYLALPPLYRVSQGKKESYAYDDNERDLLIERMKKDNKNTKVGIQRYKGLGEMNPGQLWETTMDPEKRTLMKVTVESAAEAAETFQNLMGSDVEARRSFIEKNAKFVVNLDV